MLVVAKEAGSGGDSPMLATTKEHALMLGIGTPPIIGRGLPCATHYHESLSHQSEVVDKDDKIYIFEAVEDERVGK